MLSAALVALCVVLRVVPHPANFAPVGATAVFAGRTMKPWAAFAMVFGGMFVADVLLAVTRGYPAVTAVTPFIYGAFAVQMLLGRRLRQVRGGSLVAAFLGSCAFFVLSNFGVWVGGGLYAHDASGLVTCYVAAIPFFGATLLGDLAWTAILSLAYRPLSKLVAAHGTKAEPTEALALV